MSPLFSFSKGGVGRQPGIAEFWDQLATSLRADFRFAPLNALLLIAIFVAGLVTHLYLHAFSAKAVLLFLGSGILLLSRLFFFVLLTFKGLRDLGEAFHHKVIKGALGIGSVFL